MAAALFNVDSGYAEALCRGMSSSLIKSHQYSNMTQCDTLEDLKLQLGATEYAPALSSVPSPISTRDFQEKMSDKVIADFRYLQSTAVEPLAQFLKYITYGYMIDNVILMVSGTLHNRDKEELLARCNPLGWFDTLPALSVTTDIESLYEVVLVDTPLAPYFKECISVKELGDLQIEVVRNRLYRAYLEDFAQFCTSLPGPTDEVMLSLLGFEADRRTINISLNSHGTKLTREDRESLMPALGKLYPVVSSQLARSEDREQVRALIEQSNILELEEIFSDSNGKSIEDHFYAQEIYLCRSALTQQFNYGTFYAWLKCAEQEIRNVLWIAECIAQNQRDRINNYRALVDESLLEVSEFNGVRFQLCLDPIHQNFLARTFAALKSVLKSQGATSIEVQFFSAQNTSQILERWHIAISTPRSASSDLMVELQALIDEVSSSPELLDPQIPNVYRIFLKINRRLRVPSQCIVMGRAAANTQSEIILPPPCLEKQLHFRELENISVRMAGE